MASRSLSESGGRSVPALLPGGTLHTEELVTKMAPIFTKGKDLFPINFHPRRETAAQAVSLC